ncbi:MAG: acyl carrier protein [Paludibacteraceae bacterium]|nr:acyl carrier protein [Paludibacteraceae bacterium]
MTKQEIIHKIEEIVATSLNHHDFVMTGNTKPEEITGWDSMANAMILTAIEQEFSVKFKFSDMIAWKTIGDLANIVIAKVEKL